MKRLTAKEIKKIVLGIVLSDGHIDTKNDRFDFYTKCQAYAEYVTEVLQQITHMHVNFSVKQDKRGYTGFRVTTRKHAYWNNMKSYVYAARKNLNTYNVSRIDAEALAHIWMCDGYLEHAKNRKLNKAQNIGWLCLEAFPKEELEILQRHMQKLWCIESSLIEKPWGFGYRIRLGGRNLQKLISVVYPFILNDFLYKTTLFYKKIESADTSLPNAEHYLHSYGSIEDIVRYSKKLEKR